MAHDPDPNASGSAYLNTTTGDVYAAGVAANTGSTVWNQIGTTSYPWTSTSSGTITYGSGTIHTPECVSGHSVDPNYAEYLDGVIASTCLECGDRITFTALPGGVPLLRLKALMERIMSEDTSGALEDYAVVMAALELERQALEAAESLAALARTLLEQ